MSLIQKLIQRVEKANINPEKLFQIVQYLRKYGYLVKDFNLEDFLTAVHKFHDFMNIDADEELTIESVRLMETPRCGFPDIQPFGTEEVKWRKNNLTYTVLGYVSSLSQADQDDIFEECYKSISAVTNLKFTRVRGNTADIIIGVGRGRQDNFDGSSGTLAWCEIPSNSQQPVNMKFDDDERWVKKPATNGIRMVNVACHESLHGVGIYHHNVPNSLMNPYYNINIATPQAEDKRLLQAFYGPPVAGPVVPPVIPPVVPPVVPNSGLILKLSGQFNVDEISIPGYRITKIG